MSKPNQTITVQALVDWAHIIDSKHLMRALGGSGTRAYGIISKSIAAGECYRVRQGIYVSSSFIRAHPLPVCEDACVEGWRARWDGDRYAVICDILNVYGFVTKSQLAQLLGVTREGAGGILRRFTGSGVVAALCLCPSAYYLNGRASWVYRKVEEAAASASRAA